MTAPVDLVREADDEKSFTKHFVLMPSRWAAYQAAGIPHLVWDVVSFDAGNADQVPTGSGIYAFVIQSGVAPPLAGWCMYVGKSKQLRSRFRQYIREAASRRGRPKVVYLLNKWPAHLHFWCVAVPETDISRTEDALIRALTPPANDEVAADIRAPHAAF
jgi:hypothetical protein